MTVFSGPIFYFKLFLQLKILYIIEEFQPRKIILFLMQFCSWVLNEREVILLVANSTTDHVGSLCRAGMCFLKKNEKSRQWHS